MKIHILSDLHLEFAPFEAPPTDAEAVVLAGDIHLGLQGLQWARQAFPGRPVLYVAGNHEYYQEAIPRLTDKLREQAQGSNVHVLERQAVVIQDVCFLGCTLWSDFGLLGDVRSAVFEAQSAMSDYRLIRVGPRYRRLRPADTIAFHRTSVQWLQAALQQQQGTKTVVITHHAPSQRSLGEFQIPDLLAAAYASHLDELVEASGARLWIHGHIHRACDYYLGTTRVISNPRGYYPFEPAAGFQPDRVVEI